MTDHRKASGRSNYPARSQNPVARAALSILGRTKRLLSPWVRRSWGPTSATRRDAAQAGGPLVRRQTAFTTPKIQRFLKRAGKRKERGTVWHSHVGSLEPRMVDRFAARITARFEPFKNRHQPRNPEDAKASEIDMPLPNEVPERTVPWSASSLPPELLARWNAESDLFSSKSKQPEKPPARQPVRRAPRKIHPRSRVEEMTGKTPPKPTKEPAPESRTGETTTTGAERSRPAPASPAHERPRPPATPSRPPRRDRVRRTDESAPDLQQPDPPAPHPPAPPTVSLRPAGTGARSEATLQGPDDLQLHRQPASQAISRAPEEKPAPAETDALTPEAATSERPAPPATALERRQPQQKGTVQKASRPAEGSEMPLQAISRADHSPKATSRPVQSAALTPEAEPTGQPTPPATAIERPSELPPQRPSPEPSAPGPALPHPTAQPETPLRTPPRHDRPAAEPEGPSESIQAVQAPPGVEEPAQPAHPATTPERTSEPPAPRQSLQEASSQKPSRPAGRPKPSSRPSQLPERPVEKPSAAIKTTAATPEAEMPQQSGEPPSRHQPQQKVPGSERPHPVQGAEMLLQVATRADHPTGSKAEQTSWGAADPSPSPAAGTSPTEKTTSQASPPTHPLAEKVLARATASHRVSSIGPPQLFRPRRLVSASRPVKAPSAVTPARVKASLLAKGWRFKSKPDERPAEPGQVVRAVEGLESSAGPGRPLRDRPRAIMRKVMGQDVGDVRVHTAQLAPLNVQAATRGRDVYVEPGQDRFDTPESLALLGHELTHVRQGGGLARSKPVAQTALLPQARLQAQVEQEESLAKGTEGAVLDLFEPPATPVPSASTPITPYWEPGPAAPEATATAKGTTEVVDEEVALSPLELSGSPELFLRQQLALQIAAREMEGEEAYPPELYEGPLQLTPPDLEALVEQDILSEEEVEDFEELFAAVTDVELEEEEEEEEKPDLDHLARQVYPYIKQMLAVERERRAF